MKHRAIFILILIFVFYFDVHIHAQQHNFLTQVYGTRNGLVSPYIYKVMQDTKHYLWVGTKIGASRFNGYEFENFQFTASHQQIGKIVAIAEDLQHRIWLGGERGLFCFDKDSISEIKFEGNENVEVEALVCNYAGQIIVGSNAGLFSVTTILKTVSPFLNFKERVTGLALDGYQNIYIGTYEGIFIAAENKKKLRQLWNNPNESDFVISIAALSTDTIYWTTREGITYQALNGKSSIAINNEYLGRNFFIHKNKIYGLLFNCVAEMQYDQMQILIDLNKLTNFSADAIIDAEGNFWVGTWEGLYKFRINPFRIFKLTNTEHPEVFSFLENENGDLLFGGNRGGIYSIQHNIVSDFHSIDQKVFSLAEVLCMYEDTKGSYWFGSGYNGISHLKNNVLTTYTDGDSLNDNSCYNFLRTSTGKLFGCTGNGVVEISLKANPSFENFLFSQKYSRAPELFGGYETETGKLFFYGNQGIFLLKGNLLYKDSISGFPFASFNIKKIIRDKNENIWVATQGNGLLLCKEEHNQLVLEKQFLQKDGLVTDVVLSIIADKNNNIWISDFTGISFLKNDGSNKIYSFNEHDGLLSNYYQDLKLEQQKDGTIWGLSTLGFFSYDPDSILFNTVVPLVQINNTLLFDGKIDINNYSIYKSRNEIEYELPYNKNSISFLFTAISLTESYKNNYAYRLVGLDSTWHFTKSRKAVFNYLPPGNYTFEVIGSNNSDVWSNAVSSSFVIQIPWWQSWWFKVILFLSGAAIVFAIWKEQEQRRKRKLVLLEKDRKLKELKRSMDEARMMAIRSQMNPHFIFNCMSAIQKLILSRDEENASKYLSRFSKLLRMILEHSDKSLIPLLEDVEVNRLYLELELLRFKNEINFIVEVDNEFEDDEAIMPGLLVQPFLENALLHGLLNKDGEKKITLRYELQGEQICCTISDNGIGRQKAMQIKSQKIGTSGYEPKGIRLSAQRIELLNQQGESKSSIVFTDEKDDDGNATGTTVKILLPIKFDDGK